MNAFLIENVLEKTIKRILEVAQPRKILIFGSAYRGDMHDNSDIDLLVVVPSGTHRRRTAHAIYRNLIGVGFAFDIIVVTEEDVEKFRNNSGMIIQHVLEEGRVLYAA
jgi:predicted nucleotidyltransferase